MNKTVLTIMALLVGLPFGATAQDRAQKADSDYPVRPIRMIAGWPAGGGSDLIARVVAVRLSEGLGQQVIIDNRQGAGNAIATEITARAVPNGYTLQFVNANHTLNPFVYGKQAFDIERDFVPITQVAKSALVLVTTTGFAANSLKELMAMARAKPGSLGTGTSGSSGSGAVTTALFKQVSGLDFLIVPYKGGAPAMVALLQGEVQFAIATQATAMGFVKAGKLKVLAAGSDKRLPHLPDVPTFLENGLTGLDLGPWEGIIAPARTPSAIVDRVYRESLKALKHPEVLKSFAGQGIEPVGSSPDEFAAHIKRQLTTFSRIFKDGKIIGTR